MHVRCRRQSNRDHKNWSCDRPRDRSRTDTNVNGCALGACALSLHYATYCFIPIAVLLAIVFTVGGAVVLWVRELSIWHAGVIGAAFVLLVGVVTALLNWRATS